MAYPIHRKLVIAVASSALFDLSESHAVYLNEGENEYRKYQRKHINNTLNKGVAFPFIRRFLGINKIYSEERPVEVVLLSRNDPDTGQRVFNSICSHGLDITRAGFLSGKTPYKYIPAFNVSLFLSANDIDVRNAIEAGYAAGTVIPTEFEDDEMDLELRVAFDFDGVVADDESEKVFQKDESLDMFQCHEITYVDVPHNPGPLWDLFKKLSFLQRIEKKREAEETNYKRIIRTAVVTARNAPAHQRVITTLNNWGVTPDETFFLGGVDKHRILEVMKPHIFFDDQLRHITSAAGNIPSVHIPFGIRNVPANKALKAASNNDVTKNISKCVSK
ncbi:MAG: 5'-nucleotidase [Candidatus Thiodiazotropha sp. (ex Lucinoma borealis)]|nr:5'-nucleotidase [Candidatus Thiodiazotropha sp. (ex Lucinoma borealis)]